MADDKGLPCPHCGAVNSRVSKTRPERLYIYRHRACKNCGGRFTTAERVLTAPALPSISIREALRTHIGHNPKKAD